MAEGSSSDSSQSAIVDGVDQAAIVKNLKHYSINCAAEDNFVNILALLKNNLVQKKALIFTTEDLIAFKLKVFLEKFAISVAILNPRLSQPRRMRIVNEFNAGSFDYLIVFYDESKASDKYAEEYWKRMLGFSLQTHWELLNVKSVINFEMPLSAVGYKHRIGFTGSDVQASFLLVSPDEMQTFEEVKSTLAISVVPFDLLTEEMVESLRYQVEDIKRTVTEHDVLKAAEALAPLKQKK